LILLEKASAVDCDAARRRDVGLTQAIQIQVKALSILRLHCSFDLFCQTPVGRFCQTLVGRRRPLGNSITDYPIEMTQ
jgi:hypothetical protein